MWNHSGIVVRITDRGKITLDDSGSIYILEINTWERVDAITGEKTVGAGYSDYDWVTKRYNIIASRRMKEEYRTPSIIKRIEEFITKNRGKKFTTDIEPFLSVWLGVQLLSGSESSTGSMFCSEFMSHFYMDVLQIKKLTSIMGSEVSIPRLCAPKHFSYEFTPKAPIFEARDIIVYTRYCDAEPCFIPILIITFFFIAIIWMTLPKK
jgi:hypothetical protein